MAGSDGDLREGEVTLPFDPATAAEGVRVAFIGSIRSPWRERATCPHNLREARELGGGGTVLVDAPYRPGLAGLAGKSHIVLLYWLGLARRDIVVARPRHAGATSGVFALRSPVRPNPIGLATVRLLALDAEAGLLQIDAIDCLDETRLLDIKPHVGGVDDPG